MNKDILDFWPFPFKPRSNQVKALKWLANSDAKYKLLEAPVGSGKSAIGITYSLYLGNRRKGFRGDSYILTPQKILQEQYESSMADINKIDLMSLYGKNNYQCIAKNTTCDLGNVIKKPKCEDCKYNLAKAAGMISANTVMNYKLASLLFQFGGPTVKSRKLMIMDECHNIEDVLISFDSLKITINRCKRYKVPFKGQTNIKHARKWLKEEYLPKIGIALQDLEESVVDLYLKPGNELTGAEQKRIREKKGLVEHIDAVHQMVSRTPDYLDDNFVLCYDPTMFEMKRLYGAYSFNRIIKEKAEHFLFMSSTILTKVGFCNDLGLDKSETDFLSLESEFPVENRQIHYMPQMKMNFSWNKPENEQNREVMLKAIKELLFKHKKDSGLIHTGNFQIAKWIVDDLEKDLHKTHKVFHHNPESGDDRNSVINAFQTYPKPCVLVSPSSTEGLDLKEDLGRFAIFAKVPFGYLGDQWIKKRMNISAAWYQRRALIDIIQGGGRIVRSETDFGKTYILDQSWAYLFHTASYMVPEWWRNSLVHR